MSTKKPSENKENRAENNTPNKSFNKNTWILLIVVGSVLCVINIVLACIFRGADGANIFAAISGWVSGIATIILGVIAVVQNKKYKQENDSFMQRIKEENEALITRQTNQTIFNNIMNQRCNFVETAKHRLHTFIKDFDFRKVTLWLAELQVESNNANLVIDDTSSAALIQHYYKDIAVECSDLLQFIKNDWYKSEVKGRMYDVVKDYVETMILLQPKNYSQIQTTIKQITAQCAQKFEELIKTKNEYITWLDVDFNMTLTTKTGDIDFVKSHYSYHPE